ncbi:YeeE/YedE family protein [Acinetobacter larvae]|uniref:Sulphur transport domain-containing protein n=1 Tax=Acinetobacter larvae TaxID=1789224 RepID=A0A1B2LW50_9GAMM|nr:YeeE/YedE family protein [Acinetobacter larvae]AOA57178.1 hypothetical protein BFG52_01630 [Acinetobacter larvae]
MIPDLWQALLGGMLLGVAVVGYLYLNGRIAGVSGMIAQILQLQSFFKTPAWAFMAGLIVMPFIYSIWLQPEVLVNARPWLLLLAGLLVGFGTQLGSGCTSGHGICGVSRGAKRSLLATSMFMLTGAVTVFVMRHII